MREINRNQIRAVSTNHHKYRTVALPTTLSLPEVEVMLPQGGFPHVIK